MWKWILGVHRMMHPGSVARRHWLPLQEQMAGPQVDATWSSQPHWVV